MKIVEFAQKVWSFKSIHVFRPGNHLATEQANERHTIEQWHLPSSGHPRAQAIKLYDTLDRLVYTIYFATNFKSFAFSRPATFWRAKTRPGRRDLTHRECLLEHAASLAFGLFECTIDKTFTCFANSSGLRCSSCQGWHTEEKRVYQSDERTRRCQKCLRGPIWAVFGCGVRPRRGCRSVWTGRHWQDLNRFPALP